MIFLTIKQAGWQLLIPMIGAFACAYFAHKKAEDGSGEYERSFFNQSFLRNFFLNSIFALFITLMQMYQGHDLDLVVTLLSLTMIGSSIVISSKIPDVPQNVGSNKKLKVFVVSGWVSILVLIVFAAVSPTWLIQSNSGATTVGAGSNLNSGLLDQINKKSP